MSAHEVTKASEPTEMAGVAEAETRAAHAWALDYDDPDEFPTQPTQRLTSRHITALGVAVSLVVIAVAGAVALIAPSPKSPPEPVAAPPAAVLDGMYRYDFTFANGTVMGAPQPPPEDGEPTSRTDWRAFRSTCRPAGCTATSIALDDKNHQIAYTPLSTGQWRFTAGRWQRPPEKSREKREMCEVFDGKYVPGEQTVLDTSSLEPQPDGSLRGLLTTTVVSSECGSEGMVWQSPFTVTRIGDVPPGVPAADPSTVSASTAPVAPPVIGPVLDGTYRIDAENLRSNVSGGDPNARNNNLATDNEVIWWAFRSICTAAGCVATGTSLDAVNHQEPSGLAFPMVFRFADGHWVRDNDGVLLSCDAANRYSLAVADDQTQTVRRTVDLALQPNGSLRGAHRVNIKTDDCGVRGLVVTTPITATRTGPVSPNVVLADPALFV
jgi:serine/threonine-protein kinase